MAVTFPSTDQGMLAWAQNFYAVGNPAPATWGLTAAQLTAFNTLVTNYQAALAACDPGVRSKATVFTKNLSRNSLKASAKLLISIVEGQATVTDAMKTEIGVNVRKQPTPSPIPTSGPVIAIQSVNGFTVNVRLKDATSGAKRGKPKFVSGASVFSFIGEVAPTDIALWKFEGNTGKVSFPVQFPNTLAKGTVVWFTAFWFNGAMGSGPLTSPISTILQGGGVTLKIAERQAA